MRMLLRAVAASVLVFGLAACEDNEDTQALIDQYCEMSTELDNQDGPPTQEQIEDLVAAAPPDIEDQAQTVGDAIEEADGNLGRAFGQREVTDAIEEIEEWEGDNCPGQEDDEESEEEEDEAQGDPEPAEGSNVVEVTGVEYAFEGVPATVPAGPTALGFSNGGEEAHEMVVVRLEQAKTLQEALQFEGDPVDAGLVSEVGTVMAHAGAEARYLNVELEPGTYALVCFIPGPENKPHAIHGMVAEFTVEAA